MYRTPYVLLIGIAAACGAHTEFTPVEHVQGSTVSGLSDASYDLATAGMPSEVRVWSPGAERNPHGTGSIVTVNLTVNNASPDPIELVADQLRLESVQANAPIRADLAPVAIRGNALVQPQTTATIEADFAIDSVPPSQIHGFRVKWTARTDGKDDTESTRFAQRSVPPYDYPYAPWDV